MSTHNNADDYLNFLDDIAAGKGGGKHTSKVGGQGRDYGANTTKKTASGAATQATGGAGAATEKAVEAGKLGLKSFGEMSWKNVGLNAIGAVAVLDAVRRVLFTPSEDQSTGNVAFAAAEATAGGAALWYNLLKRTAQAAAHVH